MSKYELGKKWSDDFDYEGMLKAGLEMDESTELSDMNRLFESMEDVNYHRESDPLWRAIHAKKAMVASQLDELAHDRNRIALAEYLKEFHAGLRETLESFDCMES